MKKALLALSVMALGAAAFATTDLNPYEMPPHTPPWSRKPVLSPDVHSANNPAVYKGFDFTIPPVDNVVDFHGDLNAANKDGLVVYVGGNYYFAVTRLIKAFEKEYPQYKGKVFIITIPPGKLLQAIEHYHDTFTIGDMTFTAKPDIYAGGAFGVKKCIKDGFCEASTFTPYVTNTLAIEVYKGNPKHIHSLQDLARKDVKVVMPNPAFEGIARRIEDALEKCGGKKLKDAIFGPHGKAILTEIHHRQTPLVIMEHIADAGVVWHSEVEAQMKQYHNPLQAVPIPAKCNYEAIYAAAEVKGAPHPQAAKDWLHFLKTPAALKVFEFYGFKPYEGKR
jgi:ABC-type molybdate transport system substrate-binding protein